MSEPEACAALCRLLGAWLRGGEAEPPDDWAALYRAAAWHGLSAAACMALERTGLLGLCPPETAKLFQDAKARSVRRTLLMDAELSKLTAFLERSGIWYVPLKGIAVRAFYPELGAREFADYDLLFDETRWEDIRRYMTGEGYAATLIDSKGQDIYQKPPVYHFEMHRALFGDDGRSGFQSVCAAYFASMRPRLRKDAGNAFGYHFSGEDGYLYLVAHAYKHHVDGGTGLRSLLDLALYREHVPLEEAYVAAELAKLGILDFERLCRALAGKLFDPARAGEALTPEESDLFVRMARSGTYGTMAQRAQSRLEAFQADGRPVSFATRVAFFLRLVFPRLEWYRAHAPFAYRHRWALPLAWLRWTVYHLFHHWRYTSGMIRAIFRPSGREASPRGPRGA